MTGTQSKFLHDLAESKGAKVRFTFGYNYELTMSNGEVYDGAYYDCLKKLGHYGLVN